MRISLRLAFLILSLFIFSTSSLRAQAPEVKPGENKFFTGPDAPPVVSFEVVEGAICGTDTTTGVLESSLLGGFPLSRGSCTVTQCNDFHIPEGPGLESVLTVNIFGSLNLNGFLAIVGLGQVKAECILEIIDLGSDLTSSIDDEVIATEILCTHEIMGVLDPAIAVSGSGEIGSATALEGGVDVGGELSIPICGEIIRDQLEFGTHVLVRRGHTYRIQIASKSSLKIGLTGGLAYASFSGLDLDGDGVNDNIPPNLANPLFWLSALVDNGGVALPIDANFFDAIPSKVHLFDIPEITFDPDDFFVITKGFDEVTLFPGVSVDFPIPFAAITTILDILEIPTSIFDIISETLGLGVDPGRSEEEIANAGLTVHHLGLFLEEDLREEDLRFRIEQNLAVGHDDARLGRFQLPSQFGGNLEVAREIVVETIENMQAAGLYMQEALEKLAQGDAAFAAGNYKTAFKKFRKAYQEATED